jgi:hypothetical protein
MFEQLPFSFAYTIVRDSVAFLRRKRRRLSPSEVIQLRQKWKTAFEQKIYEQRRDRLSEDVIVRDMKRIDSYPAISSRKQKGISPWFRVGLMGTYHRGILIGLRWGGLSHDVKHNKWRHTNYDLDEKPDVNALLVGYVPFENIETVDWDGDEYYGYPHVYCYFDTKRKEPYEKLAYCERKLFNDIPHYTEIADYDETRKLSKRLGIKYFG